MPVQAKPFIRGYWLYESDFDVSACVGNCDLPDFSELAQAWGSNSEDDNWNALVDFDGSGNIDMDDLQKIVNNWLDSN